VASAPAKDAASTEPAKVEQKQSSGGGLKEFFGSFFGD
jgi:hypothetical protein